MARRSASPDPACLRVLVVEDEVLIGMMIEDVLTDLGHQVLAIAQTVAEAYREIQARGPEIDAVVLDANLNGLSAEPVAAVLRRRSIPFIVASGYEGDQLKSLGFAERQLGKPYRPDELDRALKELFEK